MKTQMDYKAIYEIIKENEMLKEENKRLRKEMEYFKEKSDSLLYRILHDEIKKF